MDQAGRFGRRSSSRRRGALRRTASETSRLQSWRRKRYLSFRKAKNHGFSWQDLLCISNEAENQRFYLELRYVQTQRQSYRQRGKRRGYDGDGTESDLRFGLVGSHLRFCTDRVGTASVCSGRHRYVLRFRYRACCIL